MEGFPQFAKTALELKGDSTKGFINFLPDKSLYVKKNVQEMLSIQSMLLIQCSACNCANEGGEVSSVTSVCLINFADASSWDTQRDFIHQECQTLEPVLWVVQSRRKVGSMKNSQNGIFYFEQLFFHQKNREYRLKIYFFEVKNHWCNFSYSLIFSAIACTALPCHSGPLDV